MPLFDTYLMVDWSAAKQPKRGRDSIWWAEVTRRPDGPALVERQNPATRHEATEQLAARLGRLRAAGRRPRLIGLAFECQRVAYVPAAPHDVPLHAVLTENGLQDFARRR